MSDNNNKLDIKVGEIWQVKNCCDEYDSKFDKLIIYVDSKRIIAEPADYTTPNAIIYDLCGKAISPGCCDLIRRKPNIVKLESKVYKPVYRSKGGVVYLGINTWSRKDTVVEKDPEFLAWLELGGEIEVEVGN